MDTLDDGRGWETGSYRCGRREFLGRRLEDGVWEVFNGIMEVSTGIVVRNGKRRLRRLVEFYDMSLAVRSRRSMKWTEAFQCSLVCHSNADWRS
jgi:hypothetical protein